MLADGVSDRESQERGKDTVGLGEGSDGVGFKWLSEY